MIGSIKKREDKQLCSTLGLISSPAAVVGESLNVLLKETVTASRGSSCPFIHWNPVIRYRMQLPTWILCTVFIERLTIFFHNLGLGDDKTVVKPKKRTRGECFTECCCVPWLIGVDSSGTGYLF